MVDRNYCACNPEDPRCLPLWKSAGATDSDRIIEGLASLDVRDSEGEIVHPEQLDFSYLTKMGKLNWSHQSGPGDQLGTIISYKIGPVRDIVPQRHWGRLQNYLDNIGLWVRAKLKRGLKKAEEVWTDVTRNPDDHGLGFSLQGTATQRRDGHVVGGMVTNIALTPNPVLADTFAVLAKALSTSYARSNQTGFQAGVPEDLRDQVLSTTVGAAPYGTNPRGGYAFMADAIVGHRRGRDSNRNRTLEPIRRSHAMPAGQPIPHAIDPAAAARALKVFLQYIRKLGPVRGNVLDGSSSYFEVIHGLDPQTARALARYIRENVDKLFRKCFPVLGTTAEETPMSNAIDELEKALDQMSQEEATAPAENIASDAYDQATDSELVDVTPLLQKIEKNIDSSERAENVLAKSVLHVANANNVLGQLVKAQRSEIANLRKELATLSDTMSKSVGAICEKLQIIGSVPNPRKSADTYQLSKASGGESEDTPEVELLYQQALLTGQVPPMMARLAQNKTLSKSKVLAQIKFSDDLVKGNFLNGHW